ncbi:hypothetical protein ACFQNF_00475 [Iodobacter arcticus]|uniref:Uncharacterized protein n=1 Tax=Iodobacter arcticus TaxID=590593 RepID=A0ABW2QRH1_9NEIS
MLPPQRAWKPLQIGQPNRALTGHFSATDFSLNPSTPAAPNFRQLALLLQDGALICGQYYGAGYRQRALPQQTRS